MMITQDCSPLARAFRREEKTLYMKKNVIYFRKTGLFPAPSPERREDGTMREEGAARRKRGFEEEGAERELGQGRMEL